MLCCFSKYELESQIQSWDKSFLLHTRGPRSGWVRLYSPLDLGSGWLAATDTGVQWKSTKPLSHGLRCGWPCTHKINTIWLCATCVFLAKEWLEYHRPMHRINTLTSSEHQPTISHSAVAYRWLRCCFYSATLFKTPFMAAFSCTTATGNRHRFLWSGACLEMIQTSITSTRPF